MCRLRGQCHPTSPTRLLPLPAIHSNLEALPLTFYKAREQTYKTKIVVDKDDTVTLNALGRENIIIQSETF